MNNFPLYAALDIGSNAARILFANVIPFKGDLTVFKSSLLRIPLRLGDDVYESGKIGKKKLKSLLQTLDIFESLIEIYNPLDYAVYATAALREAANSKKVLEKLKDKSDFKINVIDGFEEARIIKEYYKNFGDPQEYKLLADLVGGSLELTVLHPDEYYISESFKIGAVRALKEEGIKENEYERMYAWLDKHLPIQRGNVHFIGTGGNINTLKSTFSSSANKFITIVEMHEIYNMLKPLKFEDRISNYRLRPDRADVILPAISIFSKVMEYSRINQVYVHGGGLSDGIILELHKKRS